MQRGDGPTIRSEKRGLALIDGGFAKKLSRSLGMDIDYQKLKDWLHARDFYNIWYYNAVTYQDHTEDQPVLKLFDFLATNGFMVEIDEYEKNEAIEKFDVKMAIRAMRLCHECTDVMFMTASNGMIPVFQAVQDDSMARVHLLSSWGPNSKDYSCGTRLRKWAWATHNFADMREQFTLTKKPITGKLT